MSPSFDPYHKWLGIPPNESPPNHYRLLGLALFESDPDVIQHAMDQRMAHLKSLATGRRVTLSERLLNEVARAGVCLLRPAERVAYDAALRARLAAVAPNTIAEPTAAAAPADFAAVGETLPPGAIEASRPFDPLEDVLSLAASERREKPRRPPKRTPAFVAGLVLAVAIGLAVPCLVLYAVNPKHPLMVALVGIFHPAEQAPRQQPPPPVPDPSRSSSRPNAPLTPPSPLPRPGAQRLEERRLPSPPARPVKSTSTAGRPAQPASSPLETPARPNEAQRPPNTADPERDAPKSTPPPAPDVSRTKVVLDISQPVTHATLSDAASTGKAEIRVEEAKGLGTPYELKPSDGVLRYGQRVEIVLKDYNGLRIGLSLHARDSAVVDIAPKLGTIAFTQRWATQSNTKSKKDLDKAAQQLEAVKTEAQNIDIWLRSPGPKPLALRSAKREQLLVLREQTIPALEKDLKDVQAAADASQRLSQLAEQIHLTATIHFAVRGEAKEAVP